MKLRLHKLLQGLRGRRWVPRHWPMKRVANRGAWLPTDRTGWTVHADVALRLKSFSVEKAATPSGDPGAEMGAFKIRLAGPPEARHEAGSLVRLRYAMRGYRTPSAPANPNIYTFAAYDEGRLAGTLSLRLDSKDGLAADLLYRREVDALRGKGYRICEFTRLAVDATRASQPVLAGLFHTVYLFARKLRHFDFVVIEVNPRHVAYYGRTLGFRVIGSERHNPRVDAPAALMGVSFREISENLRRFAGKREGTAVKRNLYVYGFSPEDEAGILGRLRRLDAG